MAPATASKLTTLALGVIFVLALWLIPTAAKAVGEYEPNETPETAYGPLAAGITYATTLESGEDYDHYFFYVTGRDSSAVEMTVTDTTVGGEGLYAELFDTDEATIDEIEIFGGESDSFEENLAPGVYYVAVETALFEQFGETYEIRADGGAGAFSSQAEVEAQCKKGRAAISQARGALARAKKRLRRAIKLQGSRRAKAAARRSVRTARAKLKAVGAQRQSCPISSPE